MTQKQIKKLQNESDKIVFYFKEILSKAQMDRLFRVIEIEILLEEESNK